MKEYNGFSPAERTAADKQLKALIAAGQFSYEPVCSICGQDRTHIQLHLEDYSRVETAVPIGVECHMLLHTRFTHPNRWRRHLYQVTFGGATCRPFRSPGHYFKAVPWSADAAPLDAYEAESLRRATRDLWWAELSMVPINLKERLIAG